MSGAPWEDFAAPAAASTPPPAAPTAAGGGNPWDDFAGPQSSAPQPNGIPGMAPGTKAPAPTNGMADRVARMKAKPPGFGDKIGGAVEAALHLATGMINYPIGIVSGVVGNAATAAGEGVGAVQTALDRKSRGVPASLPGDPAIGDARENLLEGKYMRDTVYEPKTDQGQEYVEDYVAPAMNQLGPAIGHGHELHAATPGVAPAARAAGDTVRPVANAAGRAAAKGTAKVIGVDPELAKVAQIAGDLKHPIDVRPDQLVKGAKFSKLAGQAAADVPLSNSKTKSNQVNFTRNVIAELNPEETGERLTPETFSKAMDRSGSGIGEIMGRTDVPLDTDLRGATDAMRREVATKATDADAKIVNAYLDELHSKAGDDGVINGTALRELNSEIGLRARQNVGNDLGTRLNDLQGIIEDAVQKNVDPKDGAALKDFRRQYAYGKILEPTVAKTIDGVLPPSQLMGAVTRTTLGKHLMAMGKGGPMGDLAKVGQLIKEPGSSLTTERGLIYGAGLGGGAYVEPHAAAAAYSGALAYNTLGPKLTRAMVGKRPKKGAAPAAEPPAPPAEPTTSPGAGGPRGGGGGAPPGPLGDLTPDWTTTPGGGGGPPRGGHEPGLVRSVDETPPLPQGNPQRPGSQIPLHEPRPLGDLTPDWSTTPGAGGSPRPGAIEPTGLHRAADEPPVTTGNRKAAKLEVPSVPGRPDLPDTMVSGGPAETAASERANAAMHEPGAIEARRQQGKKPPADGGDKGGGGGTPPKMPPSGPSMAETQRLLADDKQPPAVRKVLQDHLKVLQAAETEAAAKIVREHDALALEKAARETTDSALQARLLKQADALRGSEKIPVGKVIEGQPEIKTPKPEPIPKGEATEITPEYIEADRAWRAEHKLGAEDAQRARAVATALKHDEAAVHAAVRQFENQPRAFDREITRITEEGEARANESKPAAEGSPGNAVARQGNEPVPAAESKAGRVAEPEPAPAVHAGDKQPRADDVRSAGTDSTAPAAKAAGGQAPANSSLEKRSLTGGSIFDRLKAEGVAAKARLGDADLVRAAADDGAKPGGLEVREVPGGFEAYRDGKKVGYLKDNLERGQAEQIGENANVDMVKVDKAEVGKGTGRALYAAFNEKHGGRIMPSGKTEPSAWKLWKRNYPDKVDAFVKQEAARIKDGADRSMVIGNITDPEIAERVLKAAEPEPPKPPTPPAPKPFVPKAEDLSTKSAADIASDMAELRKAQPRSLAKLFGSNGPNPEQLAAYKAKAAAWNSAYRKLSAAHAKALERDNAAFRAGKDAPPPEADIDFSAEAEHTTETPEFKRWFGKSQVVDNKGEPLVVYHGTTADFDTFKTHMGNAEGDFGKGLYFTNEKTDVAANYASHEGPDLTARIERRAEELMNDDDSAAVDYDHAKRIAKNEIVEHGGATMPVYLKMEKPLRVGGKNETWLDFESLVDEAGEYTGDEKGALVDVLTALQRAAEDGEHFGMDYGKIAGDVLDYTGGDGIKASVLIEKLKNSEGLMYATDNTGNLASGEIMRQAFQDAGFDGIIDHTVNKKFGSEKRVGKPMVGMKPDTTHYVVFDSKQVKSSIGNRGTFDPNDANILHSAEKAEPFYSQLTRSVEELKQGKAGADQWAGILKNLKGVKAEEIEWSGVNDWLKAQDGPVTREALVNYLREGGVKVTEVHKGGDYTTPGSLDAALEQWADKHRETPTSDSIRSGDSWETTRGIAEKEGHLDVIGMLDRKENPVKHESWQLPGGTNYREILLTLPPKSTAAIDARIREISKWPHEPEHAKNPADQAELDRLGKQWNEVDRSNPRFRVPEHWDEPNVLAHIRLNDRVDAEGRKVLFVEEVQSDWAQRGKKRGFAQEGPTPEERTAAQKELNDADAAVDALFQEGRGMTAARKGLRDKYDRTLDESERHPVESRREEAKAALVELEKLRDAEADKARGFSDRNFAAAERLKAAHEAMRELDRREASRAHAVPNAPFVGNTSAWTALAIKRIAKLASDEGYDRVAFINGEQSAERYDLSKHIDRIDYSKNGDNTYNISAVKDGREVFSKEDLGADDLADHIGKEAAQKIIDGEGKPSAEHDAVERWEPEDDIYTSKDFDYEKTQPKSLSGLDLKVGGEGMKAFYDKIIPTVAKDVVKKLGGDGLASIEIGARDAAQGQYSIRQEADGRWQIVEGDRETQSPASWFTDKAEAQKAADARNRIESRTGTGVSHVGFDITPKMRAQAENGVPLFKGHDSAAHRFPDAVGTREALDKVLRDKFGDKLVQGLLDQGVLKYASNLDEQPEGPRRGVKAILRRPRDAQHTATLYYDRLSADNAPGVLMHEIGEHFGIVRVLGVERYNVMLNDLRKMKDDPDVRRAWDHVEKHYVGPKSVAGMTSTEEPGFIREVAAHLVETQPDLPFVRRLINEIRAFFYEKFGTTLVNRVDANLVRGLAASALRKASTGVLPDMKGTPKPIYRPFVAPSSRIPVGRASMTQ